MQRTLPIVKVTGTSAAGKSTLVRGLRAIGINARAAGQEHSQVPDMWRRLHPPDVLIHLEATLEAQILRRPDVSWTANWLMEELHRLDHARMHADFSLETSMLSIAEVLDSAVAFLADQGIRGGPALPPAPPSGGNRGHRAGRI